MAHDDLHLVVPPFEGAVLHPQLHPRQDPVEVLADRPGHPLERTGPAVVGPPEPLLEVPDRPSRTPGVLEPPERLLEAVGPNDRKVLPAQGRQPAPLLGVEFPWVLQPQPACVVEGHLLLTREPSPCLPPHVVRGPVQVVDHVEAIEGHDGPRPLFADRCQLRPHVAAGDLDRKGPARPLPVEESLRGFGAPTVPGPHQATRLEVVNESEAALPLAAEDLVDPDDPQRLPATHSKPPLDSSPHCGSHRLPVRPDARSRLLPAQRARKACDSQGQGTGDPPPAARPRDVLHARPTGRAQKPAKTAAHDKTLLADPQSLQLHRAPRARIRRHQWLHVRGCPSIRSMSATGSPSSSRTSRSR